MLFNEEPYVKQTSVVYIVRNPRPAEIKWDDGYTLYVECDITDGLVNIQAHSHFLGKSFKNMEHSEKMEVYSFLTEWELCEWQKIGPEDSELFATQKLLDHGERFIR